ncbi:c-type cytochrome [Altererythrobacter aestuarii]|uniref:C-type cytochrome n=2 Tax=Alteraurantiacibacter aestuarii TaxID=650004 RepID=A0A844ZIV1_9SPHN|nr:c-type cytochrome [Alteraurantiacibacter aestuarii]
MAGEVADGEAEDGAEEPAAEPSATPTPTPSAAVAPAPAVAMAAPAAFTQCAICHSVEPGKSGIGPSLAGVVGRRSGSVAGFSYSPAMREAGLTWNEATLQRYLGDPAGVVPGTTMALPGIPAADRSAIIAYLKTK